MPVLMYGRYPLFYLLQFLITSDREVFCNANTHVPNMPKPSEGDAQLGANFVRDLIVGLKHKGTYGWKLYNII